MKKFILDRNFEDSIDLICKKCNKYENECICKNNNGFKKSKYITNDNIKENKINYELKKVNGKIISIFYPFNVNQVKPILKYLKKKLACGGSIRDTGDYCQIILQGDVIDQALIILGSRVDEN